MINKIEYLTPESIITIENALYLAYTGVVGRYPPVSPPTEKAAVNVVDKAKKIIAEIKKRNE